MRRLLVLAGVVMLALAMLPVWSPAEAQIGKLKSKAKDKAKEKVEKKIDDRSRDSEPAPAEAPEEKAAAAAAPAAGAAGDIALYTKYDFIPGDKVIFYDDLSREEVGEFPSRWRLDRGVFEVARKGDRNFILCTDQGGIRPRIEPGPLPPKYTIEEDFLVAGNGKKGHYYSIHWIDAGGEQIGEFLLQDDRNSHLTLMGNRLSDKQLPAELAPGVHTLRVMATKSTMKCYVDNERVANVPAVDGFQPVDLQISADPWLDEQDNPMLIGTVRYAEGGKTLKEQLDEAGRIVTHGILFDSGSAVIKGESYKTLAEIGGLLTDNPELKLSIEGHTDSDGSDASNLALSQNRADAVRTYLTATYKVDGARLGTKGWGETKPIDTNDTPEGKANNRRVELVKL